MYQLDKGKILIDDLSLDTYNVHDLRNQMAIVPQDGFLFSDTIEENIKFGKGNATQQEIENVCIATHIHHNIIGFKNNWIQELQFQNLLKPYLL